MAQIDINFVQAVMVDVVGVKAKPEHIGEAISLTVSAFFLQHEEALAMYQEVYPEATDGSYHTVDEFSRNFMDADI